jgi:cyclohexa-1,5-dienecarbonyl-CoA hydratase
MADLCFKAWTERDGALLRLRLSRPKANLVDAEMIRALHDDIQPKNKH